ncbi:hypothetical protein EDD27_3942 [Nonomuraea polychroma]|uniref:Uncharacterized protein n=1 Tax=Nonomuraea polychroma TaxID=46176 RepID=A0A438M6S2_9ACTN|nr:hypothetical protein [Nonomuraea polychroma]RVX41411.1 hypothetical protein EDD27_3942 [Nonomuraea polychroma]
MAVLGTAVTAALAIGVPVLLGQGATPANAVIREPDRSIKIYIRDYKHPEVIERQLRNLDVQANVTFLPTGKQCKEPRGTYLPDNPALLTTEPPAEGEDDYWRLHPEQIKPGQTRPTRISSPSLIPLGLARCRENWLGEVEGLKVSLAGAEQKLAQLNERARRAATVNLGIPTFRDVAGRTVSANPNKIIN